MVEQVIFMTINDVLRGVFLFALTLLTAYFLYIACSKAYQFHQQGKQWLKRYHESHMIPSNVITFPLKEDADA